MPPNEPGKPIPMTDEELNAIRVRAERATPPPWHEEAIRDNGYRYSSVVAKSGELNRDVVICDTLNADFTFDELERAYNMEFAARARTDIPRLLAELDRLREELRDARRTAGSGEQFEGQLRQTPAESFGDTAKPLSDPEAQP